MHRAMVLTAALGAAACTSGAPTDAAPVASVDVTPATDSLWVSDVLQLTAIPRADDGAALSGRAVTWSTSDSAVATVDTTGRVTAVAAGTVTLRATVDGVAGEAVVVVTALDLMYEGYADGLPELFVIRAGDTTPRRIFPQGTWAQDPTPSPDGLRILYTIADYVSSQGDIWIARIGSGINDQLTLDPALDDQPAWSPDGAKVAFRSYRAGYLGEIWVVTLDGAGPVNLTPTVAGAVIDYRSPAWSPDGTRIAYASTEGGDWGIWTMDPDGGNRTQLTDTDDLDAEPTWSPDGTRIAFRRSNPTSGSDIVILEVATGDTVRIARPGQQRMPAWSPDGRRIAFVGHPTLADQPEIYTMQPDGSGVVLHTTDPARRGGVNPAWRPRTFRR